MCCFQNYAELSFCAVLLLSHKIILHAATEIWTGSICCHPFSKQNATSAARVTCFCFEQSLLDLPQTVLSFNTSLPYPHSWRQLSQASWCLLMLGSAAVWLKLIQAATRRWQREHHIIYNMFNSSPISLHIFSLFSWSLFIIQLCSFLL